MAEIERNINFMAFFFDTDIITPFPLNDVLLESLLVKLYESINWKGVFLIVFPTIFVFD